jgi:nucleoside-diphosphate kinase
MGQIINSIQNSGLAINKLKMSRFNRNTAEQFYAEHKEKPFFQNLQQFMTSDVVVGMELVGNNAVQEWRSLIGPTNTQNARSEAPQSIRAKFGTDGTKNAVHGSDSLGSMKRENNYWFGGEEPAERPMQTTAVLDNCTLCLIKPHIQREGKTGQVIEAILQAGFEISAMELFNLSRPVVEEFYCVYKNVLPEYLPIIENLSGGPVIALEIR